MAGAGSRAKPARSAKLGADARRGHCPLVRAAPTDGERYSPTDSRSPVTPSATRRSRRCEPAGTAANGRLCADLEAHARPEMATCASLANPVARPAFVLAHVCRWRARDGCLRPQRGARSVRSGVGILTASPRRRQRCLGRRAVTRLLAPEAKCGYASLISLLGSDRDDLRERELSVRFPDEDQLPRAHVAPMGSPFSSGHRERRKAR
jgi:hypothetical protein